MPKTTAENAFGTLYVVATPIGNLSDLSLRARQVLADATVVAAEDTRHTGQLLAHLGLSKPMVSMHEHNEAGRAGEIVQRLRRGESVAVVSDAGTPLISDPGFEVVRAAIAAEMPIVAIPGPSAVITALSVAGLATDRFAFEGFLPAKSAARHDRLQALSRDPRTLVYYEAPHRLLETLTDIAAVLGSERRVVVARELTKQFESIYRGSAQELAQLAARDTDMCRGEVVIVIAGASNEIAPDLAAAESTLSVLLEELPPAQAARLASKLTGAKRSELYDLAVERKPK